MYEGDKMRPELFELRDDGVCDCAFDAGADDDDDDDAIEPAAAAAAERFNAAAVADAGCDDLPL